MEEQLLSALEVMLVRQRRPMRRTIPILDPRAVRQDWDEGLAETRPDGEATAREPDRPPGYAMLHPKESDLSHSTVRVLRPKGFYQEHMPGCWRDEHPAHT